MSLATDVEEQIRRYVGELVSADDLSDWLSAHAHEVLDPGDADLRRLMDLAFSTLEDMFQGHRTEAEVRTLLASELPTTITLSPVSAESMRTVTVTGTAFTFRESIIWNPSRLHEGTYTGAAALGN